VRGGERVLIHPFQAEHNALYADFLRDLSLGDLKLRLFERVAELTAAEEERDGFPYARRDTGHILGLVRLKDEPNEKTAEFGARGSRITGSAGC
jgi:hypothetical protein